MSSRESESRNTKAKLSAEMALKLEKSYVNLYMGTVAAKKQMMPLFGLI